MNRPLDSFETALLDELRGIVDERGPETGTAAPAPRRRLALLSGVAATGVAAVVLAGLLSFQSSAAYAVTQGPAGKVVVRIASLEDEDGLEQALADHGISANVDYRVDAGEGGYFPDDTAPGGESLQEGGSRSESVESVPGTPENPCGFTSEPAFSSTYEDDEFVITIPADSPLRDQGRTLQIAAAGGDLVSAIDVSFTSGDAHCGAGIDTR